MIDLEINWDAWLLWYQFRLEVKAGRVSPLSWLKFAKDNGFEVIDFAEKRT